MRLIVRSFAAFALFILSLFIFAPSVFAGTTSFRSANIITTDGLPSYTNLENCSTTDGATCDRANGSSYANLYFRDFGNYSDFGMPVGAKLTKLKIKVTGKVSNAIYVGETFGDTFEFNCQFPSDRWKLIQLIGDTIKTQTFTENIPTVNNAFEYCLQPYAFENKQILFRINYSSGQNWSANIDNFEIAFDYEPGATPTPTPTSTPTPTPTPVPGPAPFLDLPWDYGGKGLSFSEAALNPFSWFDHQYPLQNECCERIVKIYTGKAINEPYRSHNGYDYSLKNGVELNTPVLAAASGIATFKSAEHSSSAGNVIKIDHGNGYQTWYEHLSSDDLIVSDEGKTVPVQKGQMIGRVGMTGNTSGPHIHFSVFKDANSNSTFDDDYPYGVVDPLGWEGEDTDPWTQWSDGNRTGTKSFNLFLPRIAPKSTPVPPSGATLTIDATEIAVPSGVLNIEFTLTYKNGPFEFVSDTLKSITPSFFLNALDALNQKVTQFLQPIKISYSYEDADLFNINEDTLKLYFFNDQTSQWEPFSSILDKDNKTITAETTHFSQFAVMGEVKDKILPTTDAILYGNKGENNWYRSTVSIELNGKDNDEGVGLQYTLYTINGNDWFEYKDPLVFENEGTYNLTYQSFDKAENTEERKTITFHIDKTIPEARIFIDQDKQDLVVEGIDNNQTNVDKQDNTETKKKDDTIYTISDLAGNTIKLDVRERDKEKKDKLRIHSIQNNQNPPIELPDNKLIVKYKGKKDKLNVDEQRFEIKGEVKIRIKYNSKKNQSTITTKEEKEEKVKEIRDGLMLLQLTTNQGNLEYSY